MRIACTSLNISRHLLTTMVGKWNSNSTSTPSSAMQTLGWLALLVHKQQSSTYSPHRHIKRAKGTAPCTYSKGDIARSPVCFELSYESSQLLLNPKEITDEAFYTKFQTLQECLRLNYKVLNKNETKRC